MSKTITADIMKSNGISDLHKLLDQYMNSLEYKTRLFTERLAEKGVEIARLNIANLDAIFTSDLISSVHKEYISSFKGGVIFAIVTDSKHAMFVEFGTGQTGKDNPYPYKLPDGVSWDYAVGKTIRQNPITGHYYWFYPGRDGKWHYTEGMPARPFMHNTSVEMLNIIVKTAKDIFK